MNTTMTTDEFISIIERWPLDDGEIAIVLGVQRSRISEYRKGKTIPPYIAYSIEAHDLLNKDDFQNLIKNRLYISQ